MKGRDAESLAVVLTQCPALAHLDLHYNYNFGSSGTERLPGPQIDFIFVQPVVLRNLESQGRSLSLSFLTSFLA